MIEAEEVRARRRLAGDVAASIKFWPRTLKNGNSGKNRVLDAKVVTQLNSVRVSFVNRKENGGSFAKVPAHAGFCHGLCSRAARVGRVGGSCLCAVGVGRAASSGPCGEV